MGERGAQEGASKPGQLVNRPQVGGEGSFVGLKCADVFVQQLLACREDAAVGGWRRRRGSWRASCVLEGRGGHRLEGRARLPCPSTLSISAGIWRGQGSQLHRALFGAAGISTRRGAAANESRGGSFSKCGGGSAAGCAVPTHTALTETACLSDFTACSWAPSPRCCPLPWKTSHPAQPQRVATATCGPESAATASTALSGTIRL